MDFLKPIREFIQRKDKNPVAIDNFVFRLHYKATVTFLLSSMVIVSSKQFFGDPIHCTGVKEVEKDVINSYCWVSGTYTEESQYQGVAGRQMAYPGVGATDGTNVKIYHIYYQWVSVTLLLQAFLFYFPHNLWKIWEGGRLSQLTNDLVSPIIPANWTDDRRRSLIQYLCENNFYHHNTYAHKYAFCEILNLVNAVAQIFLLDSLFGGQFHFYGPAVAAFRYQTTNTVDPTARLFPKVTKCDFFNYGSSGSIQNYGLMCILPLNIVNEKIFVVLWFWLIFLVIMSFAAIVYRITIYSSQILRTCLIANQVRCLPKWHIATIVGNFHVGDWFLLYQLGVNINPIIFRDLLLAIGNELDSKTADI